MTAVALAALLRHPASGTLDTTLIDKAREQGIAPLLYVACRDAGTLAAQPPEVRNALIRVAREAALVDGVRHRELTAALGALAGEGVRPLMFKGAALAHTVYREPWLRPRVDTDLLVRREDVEATTRVLERLGYRHAARTSGDLVTHQATFERSGGGIDRVFDVHWKIADPQVFADLFSYGELEHDSVAVAALGGARVPCDVHATLLACTHRVAHHYDEEILIFLHDIALMASRFDEPSWQRLTTIAVTKRIGAVTARGLDLASQYFGSPVPGWVRGRLTAEQGEATARYLAPRLRKVDVLLSDLSRLDWRGRLTLVREHLLPPPSFVLRSYSQTRPILLPPLYLYRIVRGVRAWFRPLR